MCSCARALHSALPGQESNVGYCGCKFRSHSLLIAYDSDMVIWNLIQSGYPSWGESWILYPSIIDCVRNHIRFGSWHCCGHHSLCSSILKLPVKREGDLVPYRHSNGWLGGINLTCCPHTVICPRIGLIAAQSHGCLMSGRLPDAAVP